MGNGINEIFDAINDDMDEMAEDIKRDEEFNKEQRDFIINRIAADHRAANTMYGKSGRFVSSLDGMAVELNGDCRFNASELRMIEKALLKVDNALLKAKAGKG